MSFIDYLKIKYECNYQSLESVRDHVRGGAPGAWAPGVFEDLLNEELQF